VVGDIGTLPESLLGIDVPRSPYPILLGRDAG
jgi:uncharacterized protein YbbK (DUF523 family)